MLVVGLAIAGLALGLTYGLAGIAFNLIFSTTRVFDLSIGATFLVVAYVYYSLTETAHMFAALAIGIALVCGSCCGVTYYFVVFRWMERRSRGGFFAYFVGSLGILIILSNTLAIAYGNLRVFVAPTLLDSITLRDGLSFPRGDIVIIVVVLAVWLGLEYLLSRTDIGVHFRALAENQPLTGMLGVSAQRYWVLAFGIGSFLVSVCALLTVYLDGVAPSDGLPFVTLAIAAMLVGGLGSYRGGLLGGVLLGVAGNVCLRWVSGAWQDAIAFGLLLVVMMFRPRGLVAGRAG